MCVQPCFTAQSKVRELPPRSVCFFLLSNIAILSAKNHVKVLFHAYQVQSSAVTITLGLCQFSLMPMEVSLLLPLLHSLLFNLYLLCWFHPFYSCCHARIGFRLLPLSISTAGFLTMIILVAIFSLGWLQLHVSVFLLNLSAQFCVVFISVRHR